MYRKITKFNVIPFLIMFCFLLNTMLFIFPSKSSAAVDTEIELSLPGIGDTTVKAEAVIPRSYKNITEKGFVYSTNPAPTTANTKIRITSSSNIISTEIFGLTPSTLYYIRPYVINKGETFYGEEKSFRTSFLSIEVGARINGEGEFTNSVAGQPGDLIEIKYTIPSKETTVPIAKPDVDIALILDVSNSMSARVSRDETKIEALRESAKNFINSFSDEENVFISAIPFSRYCNPQEYYGDSEGGKLLSSKTEKEKLLDQVGDFLYYVTRADHATRMGTNIGDAMRIAYHTLKDSTRSDSKKFLVLMTDGMPNYATGKDKNTPKSYYIENYSKVKIAKGEEDKEEDKEVYRNFLDDIMLDSTLVTSEDNEYQFAKYYAENESQPSDAEFPITYCEVLGNKIKDSGNITSYVIGFGLGSSGVDVLSRIGTSLDAVKNETNPYFTAENADELQDQYDAIKDSIKARVADEEIELDANFSADLPQGISLDYTNPDMEINDIVVKRTDAITGEEEYIYPEFSINSEAGSRVTIDGAIEQLVFKKVPSEDTTKTTYKTDLFEITLTGEINVSKNIEVKSSDTSLGYSFDGTDYETNPDSIVFESDLMPHAPVELDTRSPQSTMAPLRTYTSPAPYVSLDKPETNKLIMHYSQTGDFIIPSAPRAKEVLFLLDSSSTTDGPMPPVEYVLSNYVLFSKSNMNFTGNKFYVTGNSFVNNKFYTSSYPHDLDNIEDYILIDGNIQCETLEGNGTVEDEFRIYLSEKKAERAEEIVNDPEYFEKLGFYEVVQSKIEELRGRYNADKYTIEPDDFLHNNTIKFPDQAPREVNIEYLPSEDLYDVTGSGTLILESSIHFAGNVRLSLKKIEAREGSFILADGNIIIEGEDFSPGADVGDHDNNVFNAYLYSRGGDIKFTSSNSTFNGLAFAPGRTSPDNTIEGGQITFQGGKNNFNGSFIGNYIENIADSNRFNPPINLEEVIEIIDPYAPKTSNFNSYLDSVNAFMSGFSMDENVKAGVLVYSDSANSEKENVYNLYNLNNASERTALADYARNLKDDDIDENNLGDALRRAFYMFNDGNSSPAKYLVVLSGKNPDRCSYLNAFSGTKFNDDGDAIYTGKRRYNDPKDYAENMIEKLNEIHVDSLFVDLSQIIENVGGTGDLYDLYELARAGNPDDEGGARPAGYYATPSSTDELTADLTGPIMDHILNTSQVTPSTGYKSAVIIEETLPADVVPKFVNGIKVNFDSTEGKFTLENTDTEWSISEDGKTIKYYDEDVAMTIDSFYVDEEYSKYVFDIPPFDIEVSFRYGQGFLSDPDTTDPTQSYRTKKTFTFDETPIKIWLYESDPGVVAQEFDFNYNPLNIDVYENSIVQ